jgi:hypothetical protein
MSNNICTILEQRRQLALLKKPANRYEGMLYNNPYENVSSIYNATDSNNAINISGNEYRIVNGNYKMFDLIGRLNMLTKSHGYLWSDSIVNVNSNNITVFNSSANSVLGISIGSNNAYVSVYNGSASITFPIIIDNSNNIIKLDNISFSMLTGIYSNMASLLGQLNSVTSNYGYSWSSNLTNKLSITKNFIYKNLITLTNTNGMSIAVTTTIAGLGFQNGSVDSYEYTGVISPTIPLTIGLIDNNIIIDGISFIIPKAIYTTAAELLSVLNVKTQIYGYIWTIDSYNHLKITKQQFIMIGAGSTLFGINSGAFVSPCVLPIPTPPENMKAPGYTKEQLDMRRKAEVLQYRNTASHSENLSKKGKFAKLFTVAGNNNICPLDLYLPTPSSSSNVPGPSTTLQYHESVPLYNYASNADNYANLNPDDNLQFDLYADNNILISNGQTIKVATLLINNPSKSLSTFAVTVPIGLYASANVSGSDIYDASYSIPVVTFGVYYNGSLVPGTSITSASFSNKIVRVTSNTSNTIFSGATYVGSLSTTFTLSTQKGFVYEFRMTAATALIQQSVNISSTSGMLANISSNLSPINCLIRLGSGGPLVPPINPGKMIVTVT